MSHVARIELDVNDMETLKAACDRMGWEFKLDQKTYKWFGTHVGDYPMPEGFTAKDLGYCDHAISVPGVEYEVGIIKRNGKHILLWDFWDRRLLDAMGKNGCKLKQAYAVERVKKEARKKGFRFQEIKTETGIQIRMRSSR